MKPTKSEISKDLREIPNLDKIQRDINSKLSNFIEILNSNSEESGLSFDLKGLLRGADSQGKLNNTNLG
jgi:hypothetical protein